jgi:hypothetical protein
MGSIMSRFQILQAAIAALALAAAGVPASAQQAHGPYAGLETREIKALSAEQKADLAAGRGMGFALAAELNGYPGPLHVLELAGPLALSEPQRAAVQQQFEAMQTEAIPLGKQLIAAESELDRAFAERAITPERLKALTAQIGEIGGALRNVHLKYHLSAAALLSAEQVRRYAELRGYAGGAPTHGAGQHGSHRSMPRH